MRLRSRSASVLSIIVWLLAFSELAHAQTGTVAFTASTFSVNNDQSNVLVTVLFSGITNGTTASVVFSTSDGTAVAGVNYAGTNTTLSFPGEGITSGVSIMISNNVPAGSNLTVNLVLSNPIGVVLGSPSNAVLSIINTNVEELQFSQAAYGVAATNATAVIDLIRTGASNGLVAVDFSTGGGTAIAGTDYEATNGTASFADGVLTDSFAVTILNPSIAVGSSLTINLSLSNATDGATLGSLSNAVLSILGPPALQFSMSNFSVLEHVRTAIVTVQRLGDTSGQASVDYATSDGTATNIVDYLKTNGTLVFTSGVASASFSFPIVNHKLFQSNKTVIVALENPSSGTALGSQSNAIVTIVNDKPQTLSFTNSDGNAVTMLLRFAGTFGVVTQEPLNILLSETDANSVFTIKVKKGKSGVGTNHLDQIIGDTGQEGARLIDVRDFDLTGAGIQLGGYLGELRLHDVLNGGTIASGGAPNQNTGIFTHSIDDGAVLDVGSHIGRLSAASVGDVTITAPSIGNMFVEGDRRNGISGDCAAQITLTGDGIQTNGAALGRLSVSGTLGGSIDVVSGNVGSIAALSNTDLSIIVEDGNCGSVRASVMFNTVVFVGFAGDPSNPFAGGVFTPDLRLSSVTVSARSNGFAQSFIVAPVIGGVHLSSVSVDNGGVPFGILAGQSISSVSVNSPRFRWNRNGADDQSLGDFHVIH